MIDEDFIARMASKCLLTNDALDAAVRAGGAKRIQTINLHHLALAGADPVFAESIDTADYITADGWPIVTLMKSHGVEADRVTGSELVTRMVDSYDFARLRVGIIGSTPEHGDTFHAMLVERGMTVVYREHGDKADWNMAEIARRLNEAQVDLLLVAVTPPYGDLTAAGLIEAGFTGTSINVGGSISMVTGAVSLAPRWVRKAKLEWFYRFVQEPSRLFRRYFVECLPAFARFVLPVYLAPTSEPAPALPAPEMATVRELPELDRAA